MNKRKGNNLRKICSDQDLHTNERINFPVEISVHQDRELSIHFPSAP